jgi:hypothetical protein
MNRRLTIGALAFAALLLCAGVGVAGAQQSKQSLPPSVSDLTAATLIELRDEGGHVLLNGTLATTKQTLTQTERTAELKSPAGLEAKGTADVEVERKNGVVKKDSIELSVEKLPALVTLTLVVDGQVLGTVMTSKKGKAEITLARKAS